MSGRPRARAAPTAEPAADRERLAAAFVAWRETLLSVKKSVDQATAAVGLLRASVREMGPLWASVGELEKALADIDWPEAMDEAAAEVEESLAQATGPRPLVRPVPERTAAAEPAEPDVEATSPEPQTPAVPDETAAPEPAEPDVEATSPEPQALAVPDETAAPEPEEPDVHVAEEASHGLSDRGRPASLNVPTSDGGAPYCYTVTVEEVGSKVKLVPLYQALSQVEGVRELWLKSYTNGVAVVSIDSEVELEGPALDEAIAAGMDRACRVVSGDGPSFLVRMGDSPASDARHKRGGAG